ncbi:hypothetical protein Pint_25087 [Pistacia integerrima]|uniref:Uncharacterized protein n=1 Tax=Pistacia integerrima TaxID=434235 RepID=A0ACC0YBM6_9ROSI|nr:hypothetical protein Pint_25087 [Pistacia integerrima]
MAGFGWSNMRHGNGNNMMHELNHARKRPFASTQIACRICDQVFLSTQSLINHIETHIGENGSVVSSRRQHELMNNHIFQQNYFAMRQQERNPFLHGAPAATRLVPQVPVPPSRLSLSLGVFGPHLPPNYISRQVQAEMQRRMAAAEPARDFTKPFLDQLQQITIPANHDVEREHRHMYDSETLDLTLKL